LESDAGVSARSSASALPSSFLRIPPFPGAKVSEFASRPADRDFDFERLTHMVRQECVGGTYWAAQPDLPQNYVLTRISAPTAAAEVAGSNPVVTWDRDCDPWHMLARATALIAERDDDACAIAAILKVPVYTVGKDGVLERLGVETTAASLYRLGSATLVNPFTSAAMTVEEGVVLCGFWRRLIDSNRDLGGAVGFAFWKQANVAPLLWGGDRPVAFLTSVANFPPDRPVAAWLSKCPAAEVKSLADAGVPMVEVEDGFLRSHGLGADCVPPLSITVDRLGAYFDPQQPSELENLLQGGSFNEEVLERARQLRAVIVEAGLGKYEQGAATLKRPAGERRHILVPGQVEDDRSVITGGNGLSNLDLLKRVRQDAPEAYILYKPHPDVLAGHRKGAIEERACLEFADKIVGSQSISSLIAMVDEVHVNTSLAGFEALMRDKAVTVWGAPFYAGWGLTRDKGAVPSRRTAKRSLDEVVAAALLLYPRYLDPQTGLPCPAEIVVERLTNSAAENVGAVVRLRRLHGKLMRRFRGVSR